MWFLIFSVSYLIILTVKGELLFDRYAVLGMMVIVSPLDHILRMHPV